MRHLLTSFACLAIFARVLWAADRSDPELSPADAAAFLERLSAARSENGSFQVDFRETRRSAMLRDPLVRNGTLSVNPDGRFRREVPGESTMVHDGRSLWIYYPGFSEVERYNLASAGGAADVVAALTSGLTLRDIQRQFSIRVFDHGNERMLILTPNATRLRRMLRELAVRLGADGRAKQIDWTSADGERTTLNVSNERPVSGKNEAVFEFSPPAGVRVVTPLGN